MNTKATAARKQDSYRIGRHALRLYSLKFAEDRFFWNILLVSALLHLVFLTFGDLTWLRKPPPLVEEWEIDADLISDLEDNFPDKSSLPDSVKAEEPKVTDNMLPQLPKKFAIKSQAKEPEGLAEEKKEKDEKKPEKEKKEIAEDKLNIKQDADEANRLRKEDALKRLAMERLRQENQKAKKLESPENDPLARLRADLAKKRGLNSGESAGLAAKKRLYRNILQRAVRRNYALPEAYNLKNAKLRVVILIVVTERGNLLKLDLHQSSGDRVFDDLAMKVVKASSPLPRPPKGLIGENIYLQFTPKSF